MPLPATRTVTGTYLNPATGGAATGSIVLTPVPAVWTDSAGNTILAGGTTLTLAAGAFSQALVTTDAAGVEPATGRLWRIEERLTGLPYRTRHFALPLGPGTPIDIADIVAADPGAVGYTPVEGPAGPAGPTGATGPAGPQPPLGGQGAGDTVALRSTDVLLAAKDSDEQVTNSTALQDDDHLALPVAAGAVYALDAYLDVEADPAADITLGWSAPAGASLSWTETGISAGNTGNIGSLKQSRLDLATSSGVGIVAAGSAVRPAGVLRMSGTAGTLRLRWAQTVATGTATTLRAGSWVRLMRIS
ncbi:hypothetical protein ACH44C_33670 [Streptomyces purpureus]|uniref:hypothetical protein n=1 Tax=Streptomyces purpureus TaxID=1951 RepID=UPI0037B170FE